MACHEYLIRNAFDVYDIDHCGNLSVEDATLALRGLHADATKLQVAHELKEVESAGRISFESFDKVARNLVHATGSKDEVFRAFTLLGRGTPRVSADSLKCAAALEYDRTQYSDKEMNAVVHRFAAYPKRGVSLEEWRKIVDSLQKQGKKSTKW